MASTSPSQSPGFSVCVFCGSKTGRHPEFAETAREFGHGLAQAGMQLVYGGGNIGLMGIVADAALDAGGKVIGVIPESLLSRELGHSGVTDLQVVDSMHTRKARMADQSHAFVALPGGLGTFEELFEVVTWAQLQLHTKPVGLLNVAGYYDKLIEFLESTVSAGFVSPHHHQLLHVFTDVPQLLDWLQDQPARSSSLPRDLR